MAVHYLGDNNPDGTSLGTSGTEKVSLYGETPVVQASAIASTGSVATSLKTTVNSILTALRNIGIVAT